MLYLTNPAVKARVGAGRVSGLGSPSLLGRPEPRLHQNDDPDQAHDKPDIRRDCDHFPRRGIRVEYCQSICERYAGGHHKQAHCRRPPPRLPPPLVCFRWLAHAGIVPLNRPCALPSIALGRRPLHFFGPLSSWFFWDLPKKNQIPIAIGRIKTRIKPAAIPATTINCTGDAIVGPRLRLARSVWMR
jgi:hypothetical protein